MECLGKVTSQNDSTNVSNYIHQPTIEAANEVASNLRPEDLQEVVEGHGVDPYDLLQESVYAEGTVYFTVPNGKAAGMAGVDPDGCIWMLCTNAITEYPHTFAREAKRFIDSREHKLLWNIVDKRNTVHVKLLRFLGFKFLQEFEHGPNKLTFIEFCKINEQESVRSHF